MTDFYCLNCRHHHQIARDVLICADRFCFCDKFANAEALQLTEHQKILDTMDKVKDKVAYMLSDIPQLRNLSNKAFVFAYWHYNFNFCTGMVLSGDVYYHLTDPEIIRRTKQKLVEKNPELYSPTEETVIAGRVLKFGGILEWVRME